MVVVRANNYKSIIAKPFAPNLGAEIYQVDLSKRISDEQFMEVHQAFLDYQVLFFKNQKAIPTELFPTAMPNTDHPWNFNTRSSIQRNC